MDSPLHEGPPRWAADGRHAVVATIEGVHLVDTEGGDPRRIAAAVGLSWPDIFCSECR